MVGQSGCFSETWQRHEERLLSYWRRQLEGAPLVLELPADRHRPTVLTDQGGRHVYTLDAGLRRGLEALARALGASLFMVILAAFTALLGLYCRQEDVVIGVPMSGRDQLELEGIIGCLIK
jgi:hypothetical protein